MLVAAWAGLYAWSDETPGRNPEPAAVVTPEPVEVELDAFPRAPARTVEASADLRSGARPRTGRIRAHLTGERAATGPDRVALLDGDTGAAWLDLPLPATLPADVVLPGVPVGTHWLVTYRSGDSPRRRYATRQPIVLEAAPGTPETAVDLDVSTTPAVVLLELAEAPGERTWVPITAVLTRPDDPQWAAAPAPGTRASFEPGSADVLLEFGELGPGAYELRTFGFEPRQPIRFELPGDAVAVGVGRLAGR